MPRRMDATLKRERALELLFKRAELIISGLTRSHEQQNKMIQVNAVIQIFSSDEKADCRVPCYTTKLVSQARQWVML